MLNDHFLPFWWTICSYFLRTVFLIQYSKSLYVKNVIALPITFAAYISPGLSFLLFLCFSSWCCCQSIYRHSYRYRHNYRYKTDIDIDTHTQTDTHKFTYKFQLRCSLKIKFINYLFIVCSFWIKFRKPFLLPVCIEIHPCSLLVSYSFFIYILTLIELRFLLICHGEIWICIVF